MIIERVQIEAFGSLADLELTDLGEGFTVLHGPNEAGKSTLLAFIRFVLFGFKRSAQRFAPPSGSRHGGRLHLRDATGRRYVVERMAQRAPVIRAQDASEVGEASLQRIIGQVDEALFRSVFAFSLTELSDFNSLSGEEVDRKLFSGVITGAGSRSAKAVEELQRRKDSLLRTRSREGAVNSLLEELDQTEATLRQAQADAARYAQLGSEEDAAREEQLRLQELQISATAEEKFYRGLYGLWEPWQAYLQAREALAAVGEPPELGERDEADLLEAADSVSRAQERVRGAESEVAEASRRLGEIEVQPALEEVDEAVRALTTEIGAQRGRLARLREMDAQIRELGQRLDESLREAGLPPGQQDLLTPALEAELLEMAADLADRQRQIDEFGSRIPGLEEDVAQARIREADAQGGPASRVTELEAVLQANESARREESRLRVELLLALALTVAGASLAIALGIPALAAVAALGIAWLVHLPFSAPRRRLRAGRSEMAALLNRAGLAANAPEAAVRLEIQRLRIEEGATASLEGARALRQNAEGRLRGVQESLGRLQGERQDVEQRAARRLAERGIRTDLPVGAFAAAVAQIRGQLTEIARKRSLREETAAFAQDWQARAQAALSAAGEDAPSAPEDYPAAIGALEERVRDAVSMRAQHALLLQEVRKAQAARERVEADLAQALRHQAEVLARCGLVDAADWETRRILLEQWRNADREVQSRLAPIALHLRDSRVRETLESGTPALWAARAEHWKGEGERLHQAFVEGVRRVAEIERARREILSSGQIPELQARAEALTTEIRRSLGRYVEAAVARLLIEDTLDRYVRTRQPAVLQLASEVFAQVTGGRYVQVVQSAQGLRVQTPQGLVRAPGELSRGTAEQLYLSLRLGLAASYLEGSVALPLVMDDVLVNFDPARTERILGAIGTYAAQPGRQVLLFTCHPSTRDLARAAAPGCRTVELGQGPGAAEAAAALAGPQGPQVLAELVRRPGQSMRELCGRLGVEAPELRLALRPLLEEGLVAQEGRGRGTRYRARDEDA